MNVTGSGVGRTVMKYCFVILKPVAPVSMHIGRQTAIVDTSCPSEDSRQRRLFHSMNITIYKKVIFGTPSTALSQLPLFALKATNLHSY